MAKKVTKKATKKTTKTVKKVDDVLKDFDDGEKKTLLTQAGLDKLIEELAYLKSTKRKEVAARIKEAISYGDLSENSEYEEAKNEQAFVEGRILELDKKVKSAKINEERQKGKKTCEVGTTIHLKNLSKTTDEPEVYTIVGSTEADPLVGKISNESPVGSALLGCSTGDEIKVKVPAGSVEYKVLRIE